MRTPRTTLEFLGVLKSSALLIALAWQESQPPQDATSSSAKLLTRTCVLPTAHDARAFVSRVANLHEIAMAGVIRPCIRQHQLDEADDDGQMVAEGVYCLRSKA